MGFSTFGGFDFMFTIVPTLVVICFILIFGIIFFMAVKGGIQWNKNNNSPILTADANIVAKRMAVNNHTHHHNDNISMNHSTSSTTYYATFQVESGERMELRLPYNEYGILAEGDTGRLTFQGTRYKGFERSYNKHS